MKDREDASLKAALKELASILAVGYVGFWGAAANPSKDSVEAGAGNAVTVNESNGCDQ